MDKKTNKNRKSRKSNKKTKYLTDAEYTGPLVKAVLDFLKNNQPTK